jgi:UTP:GlnB (protein PII) uridylyltransferase
VAHASVASARGDAPVSVGLFGRAGNGLCVVADDRAGLLALISAALVTCRFDVSHAEAFTRKTASGRKEAVDLFWVRKLDAPPGTSLVQTDAQALEQEITRFLTGKGDPRSEVGKSLAKVAPPVSRTADATVRFGADESGGLSTLEVETTDRSGLLFSLTSALFAQRVQVVESEVRTLEGRVFDRFRVAELDGSPVNSARRLEIQVAILNAIEPARRSAPPPGL